MKNDTLNDKFIQAIKERIPQKMVLANRLADILCIEKEAVYRRLRKDVSFSFREVAIIASQLGISLDHIIGSADEKSKPFHLKLIDFINPGKEDFEMAKIMPLFSESMQNYHGTEYGAAMNMIPVTLSAKYEYIFRYYVYKWVYQNFTPNTIHRFKDITPNPEIEKWSKELPRIAGKSEKIFYIWDESIFQNVVKDITYFNAINLISDEEKKVLKKELLEFLDELEELAVKGKNKQGNKVFIYVSNVSFETSYSYVQTPNFYLTMIMTFTLNQVVSTDKTTFDRIKQLMQSLKRTSTLISESGEIYRIRFFEAQRTIVNTL